MDLVTSKLKSKGFNVNSITDSSITSLSILSFHDSYPSHIHSITFPSFKIPILLVTSSSGHNRWLYDTRVFKHVANDLLQFDTYKEREGLLVIHIANGLICPHGIKIVSLDCPQSNGRNTTLTLFDVVYIPESLINLLLRMKLMAVGSYARDNKLLLKGD
jgi:hypothetical protein